MDAREAEAVLKSIRYKPGWTIMFCHHGGSTSLGIKFKTKDATGKFGTDIEIGFTSSMPPIDWIKRAEFLRIVFDAIERAELHEAAEFFKVDGVAIYDPHKHEVSR